MIALQTQSSFCLVIAASLALAGCQSEADPAATTEEPSILEQGEGTSILRPDVAEEAPEAAMEPLEITLRFPEDGTEIGAEATALLDEALASEQMKAGGAIVLGGHTDSRGNDEANLRASRERAEMIADYLVENGVARSRIRLVAFGEANPVANNFTAQGEPDPEGMAQNRRVELRIEVPVERPDAQETRPASLAEQLADDDDSGTGDEEGNEQPLDKNAPRTGLEEAGGPAPTKSKR